MEEMERRGSLKQLSHCIHDQEAENNECMLLLRRTSSPHSPNSRLNNGATHAGQVSHSRGR